MRSLYNRSYYLTRYVKPLQTRLGLSKIYYLWLAFFCLILPAKLKKNDKVIDVGCGIGNLVWALRFFGIDAYGIDPSISAKDYCHEVKFCTFGKYKKLPYPNSQFDLVFSNEVLEHIALNQLGFNIREMLRVSKGTMIHMIGVKEKGKIITQDKTHMIINDEKWWKNRLEKMGFKVRVGNIFYFLPTSFINGFHIFGMKKGYLLINKKK